VYFTINFSSPVATHRHDPSFEKKQEEVEEEEDGCHMINQFGNFIQILFLCHQ
jgi:hypothetical protein